ncbi:MAG: Phosphotransferase system enzyme [Firmicutes bacterium]|nr:Phosphotransferase system enzyme [Bacillota bacterium]
MWSGIAASPGIAIGKILLLPNKIVPEEKQKKHDDPQRAFEQALLASKEELITLREQVARTNGEEMAAVFDAHLLMLDDPSLIETVNQAMRDGADVVTAVQETIQNLSLMFSGLEDEYMQERAADVRDIGQRLLGHLTGASAMDWSALTEPVIVIAHDLTPSDTAQFNPEMIYGFATEIGGKTSHSAIAARMMGIPAVVGIKELLKGARSGELAIVDGEAGQLIVNPTQQQLVQYEAKFRQSRDFCAGMDSFQELPAVTVDRQRIGIAANIGWVRDVESALQYGAEGIGLYRTEFLFMNRETAPTEEEQYIAYKTVLENMAGRPVVIRTLDVGGDKQIGYLNMPAEKNPFLGWRAIRMCLDRPELFKIQLRALWRAGRYGDLKIMFPMISNLDELRRAKELLLQAREELVAEGKMVAGSISVGMMIEIPSAALIADQLAPEVDFFSIGSNDLIQYTMGVDRMNESINHLYQPLHPAILRLISMVIDAAHRQGKWVGMCGEMAGDLTCVPVLVGLGLDEFSISASDIPGVKKLVRTLSGRKCREVAAKCLAAGTAADIRALIADLS